MPAVECFYSGAKSSPSVGRRVFLSYSSGPLVVDKGEEREVDERERERAQERKIERREPEVYVLVPPTTESGDNGSSRMPPSRRTL